MKMKKIFLSLVAGTMAIGVGVAAYGLTSKTNSTMIGAKADSINPLNGDIVSGVTASYTAATDGNVEFAWLNLTSQLQTSSGSGVYIRMRNNTGTETPLVTQIADGGGAMWTIGTADLNYYLYDTEGVTSTTKTYLYTTMIQLPAYFDGIVYLPFANYTVDAWATGKSNLLSSALWKVMLGLQPLYNSFANYTAGDMWTAANFNIDASTVASDDTAVFTTENYSNGTIAIVRSYAGDFTPTGKDVIGGNIITTLSSATSGSAVADLATAAQGIYGSGFFMRVINYSSTAIWPMLQVMGCDGDNSTPTDGAIFWYYDNTGANKTAHACNPYNGFYIPGSFDGFIYVPESSLHLIAGSSTRFDWIYGIFATVDAAAFPGAHVVFGDVFSHANFLRDGSETTHTSFAALRNSGTNASVLHNPGFSGELATSFAQTFLENTYPCDTAAATNWADLKSEYDALSDDDKALLLQAIYSDKIDTQKSDIDKAMERYDLAVTVQSLNNFIGRTVTSSRGFSNGLVDNNTTFIMIIIASLSLCALAAYFLLKKKKHA